MDTSIPPKSCCPKKSKPFLSTWYFPLWSLTSGEKHVPILHPSPMVIEPGPSRHQAHLHRFCLGEKRPQRANWSWHSGKRMEDAEKKKMINRAGQRSAVRTLLDCLKNYKKPKGGKHPRTRSLASDNICREHDASSTPCR